MLSLVIYFMLDMTGSRTIPFAKTNTYPGLLR